MAALAVVTYFLMDFKRIVLKSEQCAVGAGEYLPRREGSSQNVSSLHFTKTRRFQ
jgi:hypothetical protein